MLLCYVLKNVNFKKPNDVNWVNNKSFMTFFIRTELFAHLNIHCW